MNKKIKATGTRVGADGSGYFRGSDGKYYYGNPKNGYLTETIQEANKRRRQEQETAQNQQRKVLPSDLSTGITVGNGGSLLALGALSAILLTALYIGIFMLVIRSITFTWPEFLCRLFSYYRPLQVNLGIFLLTAFAIIQIVFFVHNLRLVLTENKMLSKRYAILCIGMTAAVFLILDLYMGAFSIFNIPSRIFSGLQFASLPTLILCCVEYKKQGRTKLIRNMAQKICHTVPGHGLVFKIMGGLTFAWSALLAVSATASGVLTATLSELFFCMLIGIFSLYIAKVGRI